MFDTESIKRTLNRKGPNCDDFKDGFIRDLKAIVVAALDELAEKEAQVKGLVEHLGYLKGSLPDPNGFHQAFGWYIHNKQYEQYRNEIHHCIAVELPDIIEKALSTLPTTQLDLYRLEREVIEAAKQHEVAETPPECTKSALRLIRAVKALKEMETK